MSDYSTHAPPSRISTGEFSLLVALLMSVIAIAIDALLPALDAIRADIAMSHPNQAQLVVSALFFGMAIGQLICGPLSDALGRKKVLNGGLLLFLVGTAICYVAQDINTLLLGRFVQGLGVSGPYVSAISIVRDKYTGKEMARISSLVMMIFVMVPALAPSLGQAVLWIGSWRDIFLLYVFYALLIAVWIFCRLEETLPKAHRIPMSTQGFMQGFKEVISNVPTLCYMVCMGLFFGSFIGYLNSSQQIFQDLFKTGELFTLYFGLLAIVFGAASLVNSRLVQKWGMQHLSDRAVWGIILSSAVFLALHLVVDIQLWLFVIYASVLFFCFGLVFGNINAMAMEPMGHVAGIAAAIIGSVSSLMSMSIGTVIGLLYNGTVVPVTAGFLLFSCISMALLRFARQYKIKHSEKSLH